MRFAIEITCKENGETFKDFLVEEGNSFKEVEDNIRETFSECTTRGLNAPDFDYFISDSRVLIEQTCISQTV
jgi:hypothetical protein